MFSKIVVIFNLLIWGADLSAYLFPYETLSKYLAPVEEELEPSGMEGIDCIYVINLETREEQWDRTLSNFVQQGLMPNRFNAIDGFELPIWKQAAITGPYLISRQVGEYGRLLSHLSVYRDACRRDFGVTWVCEDDVTFVEKGGAIPKLLKDLTKLDPDWDVLYTDHMTNGMGVQNPRPGQEPYNPEYEKVNGNFYKVKGRWNQHSILFSRKGIQKVWDYFSHVYLYAPLDVDMQYVPGLKSYMTARNIVTVIYDPKPLSDARVPVKESKIEEVKDPKFTKLKNRVIEAKVGWCSPEKASLIMDAIATIKPELCVEIGVFNGSSFLPIAATLSYLKYGKAIGIDPWSNEEATKFLSDSDPNKEWWSTVDMDYVYNSAQSLLVKWNLEPFSRLMKKSSENAVSKIKTIDFLHLDGNFSKENSIQDVLLYVPKVKLGGYILFSNLFHFADNTFPKKEAFILLLDACEVVAEVDGGNGILLKKVAEFNPDL